MTLQCHILKRRANVQVAVSEDLDVRMGWFFRIRLGKPFMYGAGFVHGGIVMLKQEIAKDKLLPKENWKNAIF